MANGVPTRKTEHAAAPPDMDGNWGSRRRFAEDSISRRHLRQEAAPPASSHDSGAEEHVRRIMEVVATDNSIERRAT